MADVDSAHGDASGKSKKKNQKRRNKAKKGAFDEPGNHGSQEPEYDPIEELRQRLADAKLNKDHGLANKLRQQLWIVQDLAAGVSPRVDQDDAEGQAMVKEFRETGIISLQPSQAAATQPKAKEEEEEVKMVFSPGMGGDPVADDKRLKTLNKKLKQIEALKEKQKKGEKLESNQLEKIKSEAAVRQEIKETEELIRKVLAEIKR